MARSRGEMDLVGVSVICGAGLVVVVVVGVSVICWCGVRGWWWCGGRWACCCEKAALRMTKSENLKINRRKNF